MIVALSTLNAQAQQRRADDLQCVGHHLVAAFGIVGSTACAVRCHAQKTRRRQQADLFFGEVTILRPRQFVAGKLLDNELIDRPVFVDRSNDPVTILPNRASAVRTQATRIGVADLV